jgi:hypothetical protein
MGGPCKRIDWYCSYMDPESYPTGRTKHNHVHAHDLSPSLAMGTSNTKVIVNSGHNVMVINLSTGYDQDTHVVLQNYARHQAPHCLIPQKRSS